MMNPLLKSALDLIAEDGWAEFTLNDLAMETDQDLSDIYSIFKSTDDVLAHLADYINQQMLTNIDKPDANDSKRDSLFDVIMTRFDVMDPFKKSIESICKKNLCDPNLLISKLRLGPHAVEIMLQAAGIDVSGPLGQARIVAFGIAYMRAVDGWLLDDSSDQSATMLLLDQTLDYLNYWQGFYA